MDFIRRTFSHRTTAPLLQIASPAPVKHWSNFETILGWTGHTSDALDDGFYRDEPSLLPPLPILDATLRESNRRREWATYRRVVEANPNTTIAPPWPPFVVPPSRSPSPELSDSPVWQRSPSTPQIDDFNGQCGDRVANDGIDSYAWWKHVLEGFAPKSPGVIGEHADRAFTSVSQSTSTRALSDTMCTTSSSSSSGCSLTLTTPAENAGEMSAGTAVADDDLAVCIAQMLLECKADAGLQPCAEEFFGEDPLADGHVYDRELEDEIRERAAVAQELNWMLMGVLPMG